jgi:predicted transcriptional regulator
MKDQHENGERLVSLRVSAEIADAMDRVAAQELLPKTGIARRALAEDLRRRGYLTDVERSQ